MRLNAIYALAVLAITPSFAAPVDDSTAGPANVLKQRSNEGNIPGYTSLDKRANGQWGFTFLNTYRGASHYVGGVIIELVYNNNQMFFTFINKLTQSVSVYISDVTQGGDIIALQVEGSGREEWTVTEGTDFKLGDEGRFEWKSNY